MRRKLLSFALMLGLFVGLASLFITGATAEQTADPEEFKKAATPDEGLKKEMLNSDAYKAVYEKIKEGGKKGPAAARSRLRVYPKESVASALTIAERTDTELLRRPLHMAAVFVDPGQKLSEQPTPIAIVLISSGDRKYQPLQLLAKIGKDGQPITALVNMEGKPVYEGPLNVMDGPHLKTVPNGTALSTNSDKSQVLVELAVKRGNATYAFVIPAEVFVKLLGPTSSPSTGH